MVANINHICICICTYRRPELLQRLLTKLQNQNTVELFTYSILVVDNDDTKSANGIVADSKKTSPVPIDYYVEPEKNIALARNKAVQNANGDFVAFIDDDEFPLNDWLLNLYKTCNDFQAHGVLGPVKPYFEEQPPEWIIKGKLCERPTHETGTVMHWDDTRTGNVLLHKTVFQNTEQPFNPDFGVQGEDKDFFRRMMGKGLVFVWCDEAPVYETVPPSRCKKGYFLRRAFLQGNTSFRYYGDAITTKRKAHIIIKSTIASIVYTIILPFLCIAGTHVFMKYLVKDVHHISRLLGLFGLAVIKERAF